MCIDIFCIFVETIKDTTMSKINPSGVVFEVEFGTASFYVFLGVDFEKEKVYRNSNIDIDTITVFDSEFNRIDWDDVLYPQIIRVVETEVLSNPYPQPPKVRDLPAFGG